MKAKNSVQLLLFGALIVCAHSLTIRDFSSTELDDVQPDHTDYAAVARYVVHKSEWAAMGTNSISKNITGYPMVNIKSIADSAKDEPSTGHIYFYLTDFDFSAQDLLKDNRLTILLSNDQDLECSKKGIDPMEPTCARIIISGSAVKIDINSDEHTFGKRAFLSRHPAAANWMVQHIIYLCKLEIHQIVVIDWYGGAKYVEAQDYYNANKTSNGFPSKLMDVHEQTNALTSNTDEDKIQIKITKGDEAVLIEL